MRSLLLAISLLVFASTAAVADPAADAAAQAAADSRVGNTVVATDPDGTATHIYWRADHSFSAWRPNWQSEGNWEVKDGKLCLTYQIARPGMGLSECMATATAHKVGDVWENDGRKVTLAAGRQ